MVVTRPDKLPRRIAVILGSGSGSGRNLLELVSLLLAGEREVEIQGVFLEEAEVRHAAELPFVKELCRVTFSVREFTSDQFEHALNLRMRTARRALALLAQRTGVEHSFRNVRGPAVSLLRETANVSDITVFEPARRLASSPAGALTAQGRWSHIVVVLGDMESAPPALRAAAHFAEGRLQRLSILLLPSAVEHEAGIRSLLQGLGQGRPARMRALEHPDLMALADTVRAERAGLLVIGATEELLQPRTLQYLHDRLPCPICLVRRWGETGGIQGE